jgi:hypothetical protein
VTGVKPAAAIQDGVDTTMVVPADGRFEWHVAPSTRPFSKSKEAYTLTCEDGGKVVDTRQVTVDRGGRLDLGPICGATPDAAPSAPVAATPAAPAPVANKVGSSTQLTAAQQKALKKCLAKAGRTAKARKWSAKKLAAAKTACERSAAKVGASRPAAKKKKGRR